MNHWFISDTHFNHSNIIKYENRPFKDVELMNEVLIRNCNQRIKKGDLVYFLGDFVFCRGREGGQKKAKEFIKQLKGDWIFVRGNHDSNNSLNTRIDRVVLSMGGIQINCVHKPDHADPNYPLNLCGHVHGRFKTIGFKEFFNQKKKSLKDSNNCKYARTIKQFVNRWKGHHKNGCIINCSVEVWNYMPISFDEIMSEYHRWEKGKHGSKN